MVIIKIFIIYYVILRCNKFKLLILNFNINLFKKYIISLLNKI